MRKIIKFLVILISSATISGCGTVLPIMDLRHPDRDTFDDFVNRITTHVRCELREAVKAELDSADPRRKVLRTWAAKIALTIRALDKGNFNPAVSSLEKSMEFAFAATGQFEADGTREMTMTYFILFDDLLQDKPFIDRQGKPRNCDELRHDVEPITGNLGIHDSLEAALSGIDAGRTFTDKLQGGPFDTITHHVIFMVMAGVGITPSLKLVNVSANTTSPLLGANRTRTDELLITMGPTVIGSRKQIEPSKSLDDAFQTERLRSAISGSVINILR